MISTSASTWPMPSCQTRAPLTASYVRTLTSFYLNSKTNVVAVPRTTALKSPHPTLQPAFIPTHPSPCRCPPTLSTGASCIMTRQHLKPHHIPGRLDQLLRLPESRLLHIHHCAGMWQKEIYDEERGGILQGVEEQYKARFGWREAGVDRWGIQTLTKETILRTGPAGWNRTLNTRNGTAEGDRALELLRQAISARRDVSMAQGFGVRTAGSLGRSPRTKKGCYGVRPKTNLVE